MALDDAAHHDPAQCGDSFTERIDAAEKHGKVRYRKVADKPSVAYLNVVAISDRVLGWIECQAPRTITPAHSGHFWP